MPGTRTPFKTLFAVPLECESCIKDVSTSLYKIDGILSVDCNIKNQLVEIEGTAAPSAIVNAIKDTGRDAILRGSGGSNSAAVCILETHAPDVRDPVKGLARMVQVSPRYTIIDLTIHGLPQGSYNASIRQSGDISQGAASTGAVWEEDAGTQTTSNEKSSRGRLGQIDVGKTGVGSVLLDSPVEIWELIGRSMVVSRTAEGAKFEKNDETTLVGVIARSAGVWENEKTVCSCSGKTVWEERKEQVGRGMI